ncbi:TA system VapC family ribonuclease toxin [Cellulomonas composti]|uniref:Ribonuclease VapC n=1 Tax=Cellulomonas composti TaxID=266130 RepID=A0A511J7K7_9CELL|nr:TA system VapC family ribonuclease toxin [Cellulomonas composti]GEL93986.1 ribonuclease VapC39 [Cellulomonas composti]
MTDTYLLDVNVLIALANDGHIHHRAAHRWFATVDSWATTPITESAFVRLQSTPAVTGTTILPGEAIAALSQMRSLPGHRWLPDDASFAEPVIDLTALVGRAQVTDFHLVNLARRTSSRLATFDGKLCAALAAPDRELATLIAVD